MKHKVALKPFPLPVSPTPLPPQRRPAERQGGCAPLLTSRRRRRPWRQVGPGGCRAGNPPGWREYRRGYLRGYWREAAAPPQGQRGERARCSGAAQAGLLPRTRPSGAKPGGSVRACGAGFRVRLPAKRARGGGAGWRASGASRCRAPPRGRAGPALAPQAGALQPCAASPLASSGPAPP